MATTVSAALSAIGADLDGNLATTVTTGGPSGSGFAASLPQCTANAAANSVNESVDSLEKRALRKLHCI